MFKILDRLADRIIDAITKGIDAIDDTRTPSAPKPKPTLSPYERKVVRDQHRAMFTRNGHPKG